jgi:hypothetical protein
VRTQLLLVSNSIIGYRGIKEKQEVIPHFSDLYYLKEVLKEY